MSDVLRRLASRALPGAGEAVRPRVGGRFETAPAFGDAPEAVAAAAPAAPISAFGGPAIPPAAVPKTAAVVEEDQAPVLPSPEPREAPTARAHRSAAVATDRRPATSQLLGQEPVAGAPPQPSLSAPAAAGELPDDRARTAAAPPAFPALTVSSHGEQALSPRLEPLLLPEMRSPEAREPGVSEPPDRGRDHPPDIRISIGRIDVRSPAEPRTAPPRSSSRPRPALMSLEDYLGRGRSGA